eukprot:363915-Chlamydomonas_euryale.AAC.2
MQEPGKGRWCGSLGKGDDAGAGKREVVWHLGKGRRCRGREKGGGVAAGERETVRGPGKGRRCGGSWGKGRSATAAQHTRGFKLAMRVVNASPVPHHCTVTRQPLG